MNPTVRIIHLEDSSSDAELVMRQLVKSGMDFERVWVTNGEEYEKALDSTEPDIILCDHSLPSMSSVDAFRLLRESGKRIPFILVTSAVSEEFAVSMIKAGIDDYILKDKLHLLPNAINTALNKALSERNRQEHLDALIRQEKKFRALLENSYESVSLADKDLNIIYRSPSSVRVTGYSFEELEAHSLFDRTHPEDVQHLQMLFEAALRHPGKLIKGNFRIRHRNGQYIWLDTTINNMLQDVNVNAVVINYRDITDTKNYEQELLRSSKHFRALIENIADAIVLLNEDGNITYQSPSTKRITGFDTHQTLGTHFSAQLDQTQTEKAVGFFEQVLQSKGQPIQKEFRLRHKNGSYIWVEGTFTNLTGEPPVEAVVLNFRDITHRKTAEQLIRKSEANLRAVFENTNVSYVLMDPSYNIISYNQLAKARYKEFIHVDLKEGENLVDLVLPDKKEDSLVKFSAVVKGTKITYEKNFVSGQGQNTWFYVTMMPVYDETKQIIGIGISSEDITERKNAELVRDKMTADLVQHNKNLEQFAYIISHNLRSPVANILGLSNLLRNSNQLTPDETIRCLEGVVLSANKIDDVIRDLNLILQKRREIKESREDVHLPSLVNDIKTLIGELIQKENIAIETSFGVEKLFTVRSYLHSIFLNLISNSVKYRNPGIRSRITVNSHRKGTKVVLVFGDNGLGIDLAAHADKIFGLYRKFHLHMDGKGMGLYMVKTQVEMLGGNIRVESEVNRGTSFIIEFPAEP